MNMLRAAACATILIAVLAIASQLTIVAGQTRAYPVVVTMEGPATAASGQDVTYTVHYQILDPALGGDEIITGIPSHTTFVSDQIVVGGGRAHPPDPSGASVAFDVEGSEGVAELTVRIEDSYIGPIAIGCYIPGTETSNPADQCSVSTQVYAPGTLPSTGTGGDGDDYAGTSFAVLGLFAVLVLGCGAAAFLLSGRGAQGS